jgi:hypothetical protein
MCGRGVVRLAAGLALALLAAVASCTYSPNPESGALFCGASGECPKGYGCASDGTCWKNGTSPADAGPVDRSVPSPEALRNFLGTWTFTSGSMVTTCSDPSTATRDLKGDFFEMAAAADADLTGSFYCEWRLNVSGAKAALARAAQSCSRLTDGTMFTWTAVSFDFTTTDGQTGVLASNIGAAFINKGVPTTCTLAINGEATRAP